MEQPSRSNCPFERPPRVVLLALVLALSACATSDDAPAPPVVSPEPVAAGTSAEPFLLELRDYLGFGAADQAAYRNRLHQSASRGSDTARLKYALALSVDRDDRASLERALGHFRALLATPDPLPPALDTLVRLQMGQVIDRLQRMKHTEAILNAGRATASALDICRAELNAREEQLSELREKLRALARIEQAVENTQDAADTDREEEDDENR